MAVLRRVLHQVAQPMPVTKVKRTWASHDLIAVEAAQVVAVGARHLGNLQRVQDRLVVLVDQHHDRLPGLAVQHLQQRAEASRGADLAGGNAHFVFDTLQLESHVLVQTGGLLEAAGGEVEAHHRMALRPVVCGVEVEPCEQFLAALEHFLEGVQEQALAEAARPRQEVVRAFVEQALEGRLVDVVTVPFPQLAERLQADR